MSLRFALNGKHQCATVWRFCCCRSWTKYSSRVFFLVRGAGQSDRLGESRDLKAKTINSSYSSASQRHGLALDLPLTLSGGLSLLFCPVTPPSSRVSHLMLSNTETVSLHSFLQSLYHTRSLSNVCLYCASACVGEVVGHHCNKRNRGPRVMEADRRSRTEGGEEVLPVQ